MAPLTRPHRSSTAASSSSTTAASTAELQPLIQSLQDCSALADNTPQSSSDLRNQTQTLDRIRGYLKEYSPRQRAQDAFRHLYGFQAILSVLRSLSGYYHPSRASNEGQDGFFKLLSVTLGVLSDALRNHRGNRRYFSRRIDDGGWVALEQVLASTGIGAAAGDDGITDDQGEDRLFDCLFAFAMDEESFGSVFGTIRHHLAEKATRESSTGNGETARPPVDGSSSENQHTATYGTASTKTSQTGADIVRIVRDRCHTLIGDKPVLRNPEIIPTILALFFSLYRQSAVGRRQSPINSIWLLVVLQHVADSSEYNLVALHTTGVLSDILRCVDDDSLPPLDTSVLLSLAGTLIELGITTLEDAKYLYRSANKSSNVADFLLRALRSSKKPSHIQFDLSLHGYASIELPTLGRTFPPTTASSGYTFAAWIYINRFDIHSHTTIFGAFDASQTCFVLAYLEKDTQNFILQTSVKSSRPSVRFKSTVFREGRWYHVGLVHHRPRTMSSSKAALFVDGEFVEQVKCQYPSAPPTAGTSADTFPSLSSSNVKQSPVQVFLGTPQDLSSRLGSNVVSTKWSLASFHLFEGALSDDLIAVYYRLGPRYYGNFQDCLGSFQTYDASAALNMRNEYLHAGKEDKSDIVAAIRLKASGVLPESQILLNISPLAILDDDDRNNIDDSRLVKNLSKQAAHNLHQFTRSGANAIAINMAVPAINDALTQSHGVAVLTGEPVVVVRSALDDASWRIGGCASIGLKMIELAKTREDVVRAVDILLESVKDNWRNSEAMERQNAFGILAALLSVKMGNGLGVPVGEAVELRPVDGGVEEQQKLGFQVLSLVLGFVGYKHDKPDDSIIVNPLAYRILLVDFDLWRKAAPVTRSQYYKQFGVFGVRSKYHQYNSKRLFRMRIVRRFIDALKSEPFSTDTFPDFMLAFRSLVRCSMSAEVLRSLALFITYALHKRDSSARPFGPRQSIKQSRRRPTVSSVPPNSPGLARTDDSVELSRSQIGLSTLEMLCNLLCEDQDNSLIKKFARTVTNKWLLYLLAEEDAKVVTLGSKILARLLVVHGNQYVTKFAEKSGGFIIMKKRLQRWWHVPTLWPILFAILFGFDVARFDFERPFELYTLLEAFHSDRKVQVVYPEVFPIIAAMLGAGVKAVSKQQDDASNHNGTAESALPEATPTRQRSTSLNLDQATLRSDQSAQSRLADHSSTLRTVTQFLAETHSRSQQFRDFTLSSTYVQELLFVLFPVVVSSDAVTAETELHSRDSALTFDGGNVIIRPPSQSANHAPIVRTSTVERSPSPRPQRVRPLRRGSSFVLVTPDQTQRSPSTARLNPIMSPKTKHFVALDMSNSVVEGLLEVVVAIFVDQVLERKEFSGFGLFLKVPPGFQEHQAYFESYVLRNTLSQLGNTVQLDQQVLWKPPVLTNMARFATHLGEAVFEGWFLEGAEPLLDFTGTVLEYLQRSDVAKIKSVRLCSQAVTAVRTVFMRVVLLRLSELDDMDTDEKSAVSFLDRLTYWQTIILSPENTEGDFLRLICYLLYTNLIDSREKIRLAAANLWRMILVQKPSETSAMLNHAVTLDQRQLSTGFRKIVELDNDIFIAWIDDHRTDLDAFFFGSMAVSWETFVSVENNRTQETAKTRVARRRERLKKWVAADLAVEETLRRHEVATHHWNINIYSSEHVKHQRALQDHQDTVNFIGSAYVKLDQRLKCPCGLLYHGRAQKWRLDQTEGRNRMRIRLMPDNGAHGSKYEPKRKQQATAHEQVKAGSTPRSMSPSELKSVESSTPPPKSTEDDGRQQVNRSNSELSLEDSGLPEDDFEIVDDPRDESDGFEDKNRKVMRSLQRGDQVRQVYNVSRVVGLEACEGLLILGKDYLYLLDSFFQRSDGEIVNVWQAPREERDPYLQMISGRESHEKRPNVTAREFDSRNWRWEDVISISKRRFLFRDVAIEVFFTDGRSYLLTAVSPRLRNELYVKLVAKAPHVSGATASPHPEDAWRLEALRSHDDAPQTLGSKFVNVFNSASYNPATRKWVKGEISNFHYLMLVNSMAGRTFNDLTQYPVFPWILADYTSEELDLENPRSFRDLSMPMGCQTAERQAEFRDRYQSFAEMGDHNAPPFHYGTHYSSAMIVASYLIRLQPFVQSYLLLQGGNFDHADRLFYSVEKAWMSASRDNMTDVRELIPEFFYLPEFLENANGYNFGVTQGTGERIDKVVLPPWAKGDPRMFISKHREALESPYVSRQLHQWIDLVFGFKQRGEPAIETTNVFHHLSYHGAKDLDNIEDPVERLATIGIIHNFGQTPHQVFPRGHPRREEAHHKFKRLDTAAESLTLLPFPLLESGERVSSMIYSSKHERLLCSAAFRINMPPSYEKYLEWGFADGSVRFYTADGRKLVGLFEHLHQGQLSFAMVADSRTLITAGMDCTVSVWSVVSSSKAIDLQPKSCLFGHSTPVTTMASSKSFSTFLSASTDGQVFLWDLNRLEFVRKLPLGGRVECACINDVTGTIMLCRGRKVSLYDLNGRMMLEQVVCEGNDDCIASCAFYEGNGDEWLERDIIFTGHRRGVVNVWSKVIRNDRFVLELVKQLNHGGVSMEADSNISASICCILPMAQVVYTGDDEGRVYEWDCVQRHDDSSKR